MSGKCIQCGKCLEVCPLLAATGQEELTPRAKANLASLLETGEACFSELEAKRLATLCLGCHRCTTACSQGVNAPDIVASLRERHPDFQSWIWKTWLTQAKKLWPSTSKMAQRVPDSIKDSSFGHRIKLLAGLNDTKRLTPFATASSFPDTYKGEKALLFAGCTATLTKKNWLHTAHKLLDGLGIELLPNDFTCCGSSLAGAGCADEAAAMQEHNIHVWRQAGYPKIITFCSSCETALRTYQNGFHSREESDTWGDTVLPLSNIAYPTKFMLHETAPNTITFHHACHTTPHGSDFRLVHTICGDRLQHNVTNVCCGFGGVMRLGAPDLANKVNAMCWDKSSGAEMVLTGCSACAVQLSATAPQEVAVGHWLETIR